MDSKLKVSLAACLLSVVLSAAGTTQPAGMAQAAGATPAAQPSCKTTGLYPNDQEAGDGFGYSVAVDGQTAIVGIPYFSTAFVTPPVPPPYISGRVAVFTCDAGTQAWTRTGTIQLSAADAGNQYAFGLSAALQGDLAVIGANNNVRVFQRRGQNWTEVVKLLPENSQTGIIGTPADQWGSVIAFDDHVLALGVTEITSTPGPGGIGFVTSSAFYVDVYQILAFDGHGLAIRIARLKPPVGDTGVFGASLALNGETLVVGDPPGTSAYVYKRRGVTFRLEQKITGAEATTASEFGSAVAISKGVILIGAPGESPVPGGFGVNSEGAAYAFRHKSGPDSPWVETQHFSPVSLGYGGPYAYFGGTLAVNHNGLAVIATSRSYDAETNSQFGPTFLYTLQGGQFVPVPQENNLSGGPSTYLGITDEYLISGSVFYEYGYQISGAGITNLTAVPTN